MYRSVKVPTILLMLCASHLAYAQAKPLPAPIGHRQPSIGDLPPDVSQREGTISPKAKALDKKLTICRGC